MVRVQVTTATIVAPDDRSGADEILHFLDACQTSFAQQTPAWQHVVRGMGEDMPAFLTYRHGERLLGVLPAYHFEGPLGAILVSCCQPGPLGGIACRNDVDPEPVYQSLLEAFVELATQLRCAVATVITNPFWPDHEICNRFFEPHYVLENSTQVMDLQKDLTADGELVRASSALRRNLRKALAADLYFDEEQHRKNVDEWYALHAQRHSEIGIKALPKSLFLGALEHLVRHDKGRFFFVRLGDSGIMVAGGLYLFHREVIDSLMPAFCKEFGHLRPNHLLAYHTMRWSRSRGLRYYNWQPSPPKSGTYKFKQAWGSRDVSYQYLTRVVGDIEPILKTTPAKLAEAYRWHYVLPYDRLRGGSAQRTVVSSRQSAWEALSS